MTDSSPKVEDFSKSILEDTEATLNLAYKDIDLDEATSCEVKNLTKISVIEPCQCNKGLCEVKIIGDLNYYGPASFEFIITTKK
jgi:hypothetical protein